MDNQIIQGSLGAIANQQGKSIAETFLSADIIVLIDTSSSMSQEDSRGGKSRYNVACDELKNIQAQRPGKLAILSFSSDVIFCPNGIPFDFSQGTDMGKALKFAKMGDVKGMQFILISDGEPNDEGETISIAKTYKNHINTIFVGPEGGSGQAFLQKLAQASGGKSSTIEQVKQLSDHVDRLLLEGGRNV